MKNILILVVGFLFCSISASALPNHLSMVPIEQTINHEKIAFVDVCFYAAEATQNVTVPQLVSITAVFKKVETRFNLIDLTLFYKRIDYESCFKTNPKSAINNTSKFDKIKHTLKYQYQFRIRNNLLFHS